MKAVEQIYTGCLAQGAYFIESEGEAAVIDPLRETLPYLRRAEERGVKIKYIFETHFHADFVSGHVDLAKKTGATIIYGPTAETDFESHIATDGEEFKIGNLTIRVLHTPGHTPESTTYLLINDQGKEEAIFTGDTLFIGDVGRPDLAQKGENLTQEDLAGWLYESLRTKIFPLPDDIIIYPAHGAGSACGKNMSTETWDTLGNQKKLNYALRDDMSRAEFIREVTDGLTPPPQYFAKNALMNKQGYESIDSVMEHGSRALSVEEFELLGEEDDVVLLDVRNQRDFVKGFIPGSVFIGLDGSFAPWVGALIPDIKQKIILIAPEGREEETVMRLARVGYDHALGYLKGGFSAWKAAGKTVHEIQSIDVPTFKQHLTEHPEINILDVRKPNEYEKSHLTSAHHFPLDFINAHMAEINPSSTYYLQCRSGYRSTITASILKARGYHHLIDVIGAFDDMQAEDMPMVGTCESVNVRS
ncbi:MAG: MBL fold metallo-hydrolase [Bacteroidota bacterium]|nr:MBL fold metallo-hydrolase [Bacteroidota bacterium]